MTSRKMLSEKRLCPEKSASSTHDQSATELPSLRKNIFARLGAAGAAAGKRVAGFGSAMRKNSGASARSLTTGNLLERDP
jgi:hypothetical protein